MMLQRLFLVTSLLLVSHTIYAMEIEKISSQMIKMGPILHFNGQNMEGHRWKVSALYLVKINGYSDTLVLKTQWDQKIVKGHVLGTRFGSHFVRFDMDILQTNQPEKVEYHLEGENEKHSFIVPAIGQSANILYHSCNGYQKEGDRRSVGGIAPMWQEINRRHAESPFHIQFAGGDQLYADGIIDEETQVFHAPKVGETYGVFALPTLQEWISNKKFPEIINTTDFNQEMQEEVEKFYFDHYIKQYNELGFKDAIASIPSLAQPDDHDFFDGCGSYPEYLQNSTIIKGIRKIAKQFCFIVQHQIEENDIPLSYNYLHTVNEGRLAILGVDTRSERTPHQVVSPHTWDIIFKDLKKLPQNCQHLTVMLGIPIVFASAKKLERVFDVAHNHAFAGKLLGLIPGMKNVFGLFELEDDCRDGWGHHAHVQERDQLISRLQRFAEKTGIRVTLFGGDVHIGGAGKIYHCESGIDDSSPGAICQIISSPVGNVVPGKIATRAIGFEGSKAQRINNDYAMCLLKLRREDDMSKDRLLIDRRNFAIFSINRDKDLEVEWSAEPNPQGKNAKKAHRIYYLIVPPTAALTDEKPF